ncbi:MAG: phosphodiester glycosidase family protein [Planctomycetota bacterium]|jgi:exopolysaccharide biosynthesis protein
MTLGDVSRLLILLGCRDAINLDGGSSKRMLVAGRIVDLPSTEIIAGEAGIERVRPVHTAILFQPRG